MMARLPAPDTVATDPIAGSVLAHLPRSLFAFRQMYATLWEVAALDAVSKEIARMRNARVTDCGYCRNVRFDVPRHAGLTEAMLDLVAEGYEESALSPRHKAVLRFADAFLTDPTALGVFGRETLLAELAPVEIVELAAALALFMGFSKIAVALGTAPASMPVTVLPTPALRDV